ncbi:LCP family glycopolymer transferase, partial [Atopobiaceae bacterium HCP3S3_D6]
MAAADGRRRHPAAGLHLRAHEDAPLARVDAHPDATFGAEPPCLAGDLRREAGQELEAGRGVGEQRAEGRRGVEAHPGVDISHYAEANLDSFASVVDQVGGVTVNLPTPVHDP